MQGSRSPEETRHLFECQRQAFRRHTPLGYKRRIEALDALLQVVLLRQAEIIEAIQTDFGGRSPAETRILEIFPLVDEIRHAKRHLRSWMQGRRAKVNWQFLPSRAEIHFQPLGVVGIIGAWNYPLLLTLSPLVGALAAGNHVLIKPPEAAPATAFLVQEMLSEAFAEEYVAVVNGGRAFAAFFAALPFDHLLFTGSSRTGRLVMKAAAENLTPVTLELGGKSPALVHESFPMARAADRICAAKFWNAGQTCVAPDYALVPAHRMEEFLRCAESSIRRRFARPATNRDYTRMMDAEAWNRMRELVEDARSKGARIIEPGGSGNPCTPENGAFAPTLIAQVNDSMRVMQEEIFGPILPVLGFSNLQEALSQLQDRPRPLAFYYFDRRRSRIQEVLEHTLAGGITVNDCIFHLPQDDLPFGGVGPSGMGAYHGFDGFTTFSKKTGVLLQSALTGAFFDRFIKPPYSAAGARIVSSLIGSAKKRGVRRMTLEDE